MGEKRAMSILKQKEEYAIKQIQGSDEQLQARAALWNNQTSDFRSPTKEIYPYRPVAAVVPNNMINDISLSSTKRSVDYIPPTLNTLSKDIDSSFIQGSVKTLYEHAQALAKDGQGTKKKFMIYIVASNEEDARKVAQHMRDAYGIKYSISNPQRLDKKTASADEKKLLSDFKDYQEMSDKKREKFESEYMKFDAKKDQWRFRTDHIKELTGDLYPFGKGEEKPLAPVPAQIPVAEINKALLEFIAKQMERKEDEVPPEIRTQIPGISEKAGYDKEKAIAALIPIINAYLAKELSQKPGVFGVEVEYDPAATEKEWSENLDKRLNSMDREQLKAREKELNEKKELSELDQKELARIFKRVRELGTDINRVDEELKSGRK
jgi:hypothetical protein